MLDSIFINGLQHEIQAEMKLYDYHDLADLMDIALLLEEKNEAKKGIANRDKGEWKDMGVLPWFRSPGEFNRERKGGAKTSLGGGEKSEIKNEGGKGKRLGPPELEERSKNGLCFKCGEKWGEGPCV
ncbi:hypothetical protein L195_g010410 [Trifolium pratense]|uniref:Uncharacterized protein n=1 Tax=Trifolium pratense TaxID=57577 RepID=A0A2K3PET1_TRIPR|nr:hypothetical protein L195_g010410 [Trifolium pratense]